MADMLDFVKAEFKTSYGLSKQLPPSTLPEVVFAGRSNVGKSSLINKLCNRKRLARVSATPGKTATINFYQAGEAYMVDLPGYGYAKTSASERTRWDALINGYFAQKRNIPLLLQLLDSRHAPSKDDMGMLQYLDHYQIPFVVVLTKLDKFKPSKYEAVKAEMAEHLQDFKYLDMIATSAEKGTGIEELKLLMTTMVENSSHGL